MKVEVALVDLTLLAVDAIVNAANTTWLGGSGVDGAIHRAAGPELKAYCVRLGGCETGEAKITPGFDLAAKYVVHTPGPIYSEGHANACDDLLFNSWFNSLKVADEHGCKSIAFPSISTGAYRFPLDRASQIARRAILEFKRRPSRNIERIVVACFDRATYDAYAAAFKGIDAAY